MYGLSKEEIKILKKLNTPIKIQNFLDTLPINFEKDGETYMSPCRVLRENKAHCLEGAMLAVVCLWINKKKGYILDLKSDCGDDHTLAMYRINGYWGAISKTNHATLRFRDPIYKTVRELALSFFHEYFDVKTGKKILESYSLPFDLKKNFGTNWITREDEMFDIAEALDNAPHEKFYPNKNKKFLRKADCMELKAGNLLEWKESDERT
jgi:hypothetical protein